MLQFLRKIRRTAFQGRNLKRYFAYALGEILLVVVGILIALKINDLQKEKQDRRDEQNYLSRLVEDLKMDDEDIAEANEFALQRIAISTWVLAQFGDSSETFRPEFILQKAAKHYPVPVNWTRDSIGLALSLLRWARFFDHHDVTYQEMVVSSKLQVIQDLELRAAINRHFAAAKKAKGADLDLLKAQNDFSDALKSIGITPNTAANTPDAYANLLTTPRLLVEIKYIRDMALRQIHILEEPKIGIFRQGQELIQRIEQQLEL